MKIFIETKSIQELIDTLNEMLINHHFYPCRAKNMNLSPEEHLFEVLLKVSTLQQTQVLLSLRQFNNPTEKATVAKVLKLSRAYNVYFATLKTTDCLPPSFTLLPAQLISEYKRILTLLSDQNRTEELKAEQIALEQLAASYSSSASYRNTAVKFHVKKLQFLIAERIGTMDSIKNFYEECKALYFEFDEVLDLDILEILARMRSHYHQHKDYSSALRICEEIDTRLRASIAAQPLIDRSPLMARNLLHKAEIHKELLMPEQAITIAKSGLLSMKQFNSQENDSLQNFDAGMLHRILASSYLNQSKFDLCIEHSHKALQLLEKFHVHSINLYIYKNMSIAYQKMGLHEEVAHSFRQIVDIFNKLPGDNRVALASGLFRLGKALVITKRFQEALEKLKKADALFWEVSTEPTRVVDQALRLQLSTERSATQNLIKTVTDTILMPPPAPGIHAILNAAARLTVNTAIANATTNPYSFYVTNSNNNRNEHRRNSTPKRIKLTPQEEVTSCNPKQ